MTHSQAHFQRIGLGLVVARVLELGHASDGRAQETVKRPRDQVRHVGVGDRLVAIVVVDRVVGDGERVDRGRVDVERDLDARGRVGPALQRVEEVDCADET